MMFVITCSGLVFCACEDESENVIPDPIITEEGFATSDSGKSDDPMD